MAFGETAGGVEAAAVQAEVEALDESSDDVDLDASEMKVRRKSKNTRLRRPKGSRIGMLNKNKWMPLSHLRKLPSALKHETDRLRGDKDDQVYQVLTSLSIYSHIAGYNVSRYDGSLAAPREGQEVVGGGKAVGGSHIASGAVQEV